jgi:hypothetical protein
VSRPALRRFHLAAIAAFGGLQALALAAHYLGPSPYGGRLNPDAHRYLPEALAAHLALVVALVLAFALLERPWPPDRGRAAATACAAAAALLVAFNQFDLEVVRWMGEHVNLSYLATYVGGGDWTVVRRALAADRGPTALAVAWVIAAVAVAALLVRADRRGRLDRAAPRWAAAALALAAAALLAAAWGARNSEKRWRRIRPPLFVVGGDLWRAARGSDRPRDAARAARDLAALAFAGRLSASGDPPPAEYPLWRASGPGTIPLERWRALPRERRPNVVVIVFETWRAWKSGLIPARAASRTPELDALLTAESAYFPWVHSNGFPSVEGGAGLLLGVWPDTEKVFLADFLHLRTRGLAQILREAGYRTYARLGTDPAFDGFTPWMRRLYDETEYDAAIDDDRQLVDRFLGRYDALTRGSAAPVHALLWTLSTHPPYDLPERDGFVNPPDSEARYDQAVRFADREIARLLRALRARPDWDGTVVVLVGDHSQPTPFQRANPDLVCELTPGHTWTSMAILGGFPRVPPPGRRDAVVSHVDLAPTLLSLLDISSPNHFVGVPLDGLPAGGAWPPARVEPLRPVLSVRWGDAVVREDGRLVCLSVRNRAVRSFAVDPLSPERYAMLEGFVPPSRETAPPGFDADRWRDVVLAYGKLLRDNRLMPPQLPQSAATARQGPAE